MGQVTIFPLRQPDFAVHRLSAEQYARVALRHEFPAVAVTENGLIWERSYFSMLPKEPDPEAQVCALLLFATPAEVVVSVEALRSADLATWELRASRDEMRAFGKGWFYKRALADIGEIELLREQ